MHVSRPGHSTPRVPVINRYPGVCSQRCTKRDFKLLEGIA